MNPAIYKIMPERDWRLWQSAGGAYPGAAVDQSDGFIHFSTAGQVRETAARHFAGQDGLVLLAIDAALLGDKLVYEPSRGGDLFPHLYGPLPLGAVLWARPLKLRDGAHHFPELPA